MDKAKLIEWLKSDKVQILVAEVDVMALAPLHTMQMVLSYPPEHSFEGIPKPLTVESRPMTVEEEKQWEEKEARIRKQIQEGWEPDDV